MLDDIINTLDALIEAFLKSGFVDPEQYGVVRDAIVSYFNTHGSDTYLRHYMEQDRFYLYGMQNERYSNPSDLMGEIEYSLTEEAE